MTAKVLAEMGEAVSCAIERFVAMGKSIWDDHPELHSEMCEPCLEARQLTMRNYEVNEGLLKPFTEKNRMVRASLKLLLAITKVLPTKNHMVLFVLMELESIDSFTGFVKAFSKFGNNMVELAHLTGEKTQSVARRSKVQKLPVMTLVPQKNYLMDLALITPIDRRLFRESAVSKNHNYLPLSSLPTLSDVETN